MHLLSKFGRFIAVVCVATSVALFAQKAWADSRDIVKVYEHPDYVGTHKSWELKPGMRHVLVANLGNFDNRISSITVGQNVMVIGYFEKHFYGRKQVFDRNNPNLTVHTITNANDKISSLIIYRRGHEPKGARLRHDVDKGVVTQLGDPQSFPLPQKKEELAASYPEIASELQGKDLTFLLDNGVTVQLFSKPNFLGESLSLPGHPPGQQSGTFDLSKYNFANKVRSLKVYARIRAKLPSRHQLKLINIKRKPQPPLILRK